MLPETERAAFMQRFAGRDLSMSLWQLHLVTDRPLRELGVDAYSTFVLSDSQTSLAGMREQSSLLASAPNGRIPTYVLVDYSGIDSGLGSEGNWVASVSGVDKVENWEGLSEDEYKRRKDEWCQAIIGDIDRRFPGFADSVKSCEMATARTMQRFLNSPGGAIYGISQEPLNAGRFRPTARTAVKGLFLSNAHAMPGGGFTGAMLAGQGAFRTAVRDRLL